MWNVCHKLSSGEYKYETAAKVLHLIVCLRMTVVLFCSGHWKWWLSLPMVWSWTSAIHISRFLLLLWRVAAPIQLSSPWSTPWPSSTLLCRRGGSMERWVVIVRSTANENWDQPGIEPGSSDVSQMLYNWATGTLALTTLKEKKQKKKTKTTYNAKLLHTFPWPYRLAGMYPMTSMSLTSVCVWMSSTPTWLRPMKLETPEFPGGLSNTSLERYVSMVLVVYVHVCHTRAVSIATREEEKHFFPPPMWPGNKANFH